MRFLLSTVYPGPDSSAGSSAPANRSHHPAAADRLSFRKQSTRQYTGQHYFHVVTTGKWQCKFGIVLLKYSLTSQ